MTLSQSELDFQQQSVRPSGGLFATAEVLAGFV